MQDKPSEMNDAVKLPRAQKELDDAEAIYEGINGAISSELPQLLDLRIPYLDPSFEAMVRLQTKFFEDAYERTGGVQRYLPEHVRVRGLLLL